MCVYIYIYIYIYTHTHTHTHTCMKCAAGFAHSTCDGTLRVNRTFSVPLTLCTVHTGCIPYAVRD